jgi:hypothetical protein
LALHVKQSSNKVHEYTLSLFTGLPDCHLKSLVIARN